LSATEKAYLVLCLGTYELRRGKGSLIFPWVALSVSITARTRHLALFAFLGLGAHEAIPPKIVRFQPNTPGRPAPALFYAKKAVLGTKEVVTQREPTSVRGTWEYPDWWERFTHLVENFRKVFRTMEVVTWCVSMVVERRLN